MNLTKYQVFISSTYSDIEDERDSIIKAVLEMYHIPIGMEMFSAEDEDQWEIIRRTIEVSDYYILILGLRYGSKTSDGISFTQKEYQYALENKIPILAFVMNETVPLSKDKRDDDLTEINNFRELVLKNSRMAQFWSLKEELIKNVSISLMKQIMQKPAVGWVRGDKLGSEEALTKELASLSKDNRQLREKISDLESRISPKKPIIEVAIDPPKVDENFNKFEKLILPNKVDLNDIAEHLQKFISNEDIEKYNREFPTELEIEHYNNEKERIYKLDNYSTPLVLHVSNKGSMKANNLFIDIIFPDGLLVYIKGEKFSKPKNPLPNNPIKMAQSRYKKNQEEAFRKSISHISLDNVFGADSQTRFDMRNMNELLVRNVMPITNINQDNWTNLKGNKVTIKLNNLLHTRRRTFDDEYMLVPLKSGSYQIEIRTICEEYESTDIQMIEVVV
ncbi:DUF4062 domain-containing protein [Pseudocolwellia agarivorans]|uniref:DUF4062 domain-containing protein n=1 Tax=Pseudocolwellia agarivorans TaxID=1911682 RepID=UPI00098691CD|nr:DUF4062 domain-containing protein [Pseudocolwellia agarivorans]